MISPTTSMSTPLPPSTEPPSIRLGRKFVLLGLLMVAAALGLLLVMKRLHVDTIFLPHVFADAIMGLIAGLSTRWVLGKQTLLLRLVAILGFLIGGLELLGWFTGWQIGLGLLQTGRANADWFSLGQLILAAGVALLALYGWVQPAGSLEPEPIRPIIPAEKRPRQRTSPEKRPRRKPRPTVGRPARSTPVVIAEPVATTRRRKSIRRKPQLQLSNQEEHRCPYCLEPIIPNDPRGTVECQICHTLHHADCWAITGSCQVPHFTA